MIVCPNKNSKEWKTLVDKVGENRAYYLWATYKGEVPENVEEVAYKFKGVDAALKNMSKIQGWEKQIKDEDILWKKIQELGIPKQQASLIRESEGNTVEEKVINFLSNYSYTVEINTAKEKAIGDNETRQFTLNGFAYRQGYSSDGRKRIFDKVKINNENAQPWDEDFLTDEEYEITEQEFLQAKKQAGLDTGSPTQYYSNLSAPSDSKFRNKYEGNPDWEYHELNIETPLITPSIKGHAQFATDNGIGWVRIWYNKKTGVVEIQELQSDLFQKGRDKETLVKREGYGTFSEPYISIESDGQEDKFKSNQFLQLLNKDNNWVTFFIKSIIQDSAKKGYEKVLFPLGDTASKVEGHTTLEEEINNINLKIDKLKNLKNNPNRLTRKTTNYAKGEYIYTDNVSIQFESNIFNIQDALDSKIIELEKSKEELKNQEIEKLKPIYNFYENTVTNILKKQGYIPTLITDEYGNTWNEVEIKKDYKDTIFLQKAGTEPLLNQLLNKQEKLYNAVQEFIKKAGIKQTTLLEYAKNHNILSSDLEGVNGLANPLEGLIAAVEGREFETIPEEAMHIAVAILKDIKPSIYEEMMIEVTKLPIYKEVFPEYSNIYRNANGSLNITKIKEEAIAKQLVRELNQEVNKTFWDKIRDFFLLLFRRTGFRKALDEIRAGSLNVKDIKTDDGVYYQTKGIEIRDALVSKIQEKSDNITLADSSTRKDEKGNPKKVYFFNGKELRNRVTDMAKQLYERWAKYNDITKSEYQQAVDELKAEKGTAAHADVEHIIKSITDETGKFIGKQDTQDNYKPKTSPEIYAKLEEYLLAKLATYPEARIKTEVKIADENYNGGTGGSLDVLIFLPDGKLQILDWKFMDLDISKYDDIPTYKLEAFDRQMEGYKNILVKAYGLKKEDISATIIPVRTKYLYKNSKKDDKKELPVLLDIELGDVDVQNIEDDYLLPYNPATQSTGNKKLDEIVHSLTKIKKSIRDTSVYGNANKKIIKDSQLNDIAKAIRHIQAKGSLVPFTEQALHFIQNSSSLLSQYAEIEKLSPKQNLKLFSEYGANVEQTINFLEDYKDFYNKFHHSDIDADIKATLDTVSKEAFDIKEKLENEVLKPLIVKVAEDYNVKNILEDEKQVSSLSKQFTATGKQQPSTIQLLFSIIQNVKNERDVRTRETLDELQSILKDAPNDIFSTISSNNKLHRQYSKKFYEEVSQAVKTKDYKWVQNNIDVERYKEKIEQELQFRIDYENSKSYQSEEQINENIIKLKKKYSLAPKGDGWFISKELKRFPTSNHYSEEYKKIQSNPKALQLYNFIQKINEFANEVGYLASKDSWKTFLPYRKKLEFEKNIKEIKIFDGLLRSLTVNEEDFIYGEIDESTGQPVEKIPTPFRKLEEGYDFSQQYGENLGLYIRALFNFAHLSDIEGLTKVMHKVEATKNAIAITNLGNIRKNKDTGEIEKVGNNIKNTEFFLLNRSGLLYGQKYISSENYDNALGKVGDFFEKTNNFLHKKLGIKPFPEDLKGRQYSMNKTIDTVNKFFQLKVLGLNPFSGISQLLGGKFQNYINAGKYMTNSDFKATEFHYLMGYMNQTEEGKKLVAALKYFDPWVKNEAISETIKKLNTLKLNSQSIQDFLMFGMRAGDWAIQTQIFAGLWKNMVIVDGKIENAREYVKSLPKYQNITSQLNTTELEKEIEQLIKEKSISKFSKVVDDKLVIEGINMNDESVFEQKNIAKALTTRAVGSLSDSQLRGINTNIWTNSLMIFKNWIPSLLASRFENASYSKDLDAWEWGRARTMATFYGANVFKYLGFFIDSLSLFLGAKNFIPAISEGGKVIKGDESTIPFIKEMYEREKEKYINQTGKSGSDFMTEVEFAELVKNNMYSMAKELAILTITMSAFLVAKSAGDDEEDKYKKAKLKYLQKALDKVSDEVWFYYSPQSLASLTNGSLFPSISVFTDAMKAMEHTFLELYGYSLKDEKYVEDNKVAKYWLKLFPITNQLSSMIPFFAPEVADELGIKATSQSRR